MNVNQTFIPERLKVGFNSRQDTFGNRLGYVIYFDEKGKLRKNVSWDSWRDQNIEPLELDNEPTTGFVVNRGITRKSYEWRSVAHKVRIHDPRGFEVEVDHNNMVALNIHCLIDKGEIKSPLVYMWVGKELWLLPVESDLYEQAKEVTRKQSVKVKKGALIVGGMYSIKKTDSVCTYLGEFIHTTEDKGYFDAVTGKSIGYARAKKILEYRRDYEDYKKDYETSVSRGQPSEYLEKRMNEYEALIEPDFQFFHGVTYVSSKKHIFLTKGKGYTKIETMNIANISDCLGMDNQEVVDKHVSLYQENLMSKTFASLQQKNVAFEGSKFGESSRVFFRKGNNLYTIRGDQFAVMNNVEHRLVNGKHFYCVSYRERYHGSENFSYACDWQNLGFLFGQKVPEYHYGDSRPEFEEKMQAFYQSLVPELHKLEFFTFEWTLEDGNTKSLEQAFKIQQSISVR